jgi:Domain of unknown function (DUF4349)
MNAPKLNSKLFVSTLLGGLLIASCSSVPTETAAPEMAQMADSPAAEGTQNAVQTAATKAPATKTQVPQAPPQLIKTAELSLVVNSIEEVLTRASAIAKQQQGDVISLQETKPDDNQNKHKASMQLRVPQGNLDATLKGLSQLGTVQSQNINAQDVSNQLVDFQARLRNLRKTESTLLGIMDRSGSVGDVLKVAQELSNVRSQIEQIDAQLKDLQNRVAFSTITLQLEAATATIPQEQPLGVQFGESWRSATHSVGQLTSSLLKLGLWLLAYSPYLLMITAGVWLGLKRRKNHPNSRPTPPEPQ